MGPPHRMQHNRRGSPDAEQAEALPPAPREPGHGRLTVPLEHPPKERVRLDGYLAAGFEVVALADPDGVDVAVRHERNDLDRLRRGQGQVGEVLVSDRDDRVPRDLIPFTDLLGADLALLDLSELFGAHSGHVVQVVPTETHAVILRGCGHLDRDRDQAKADGAGPDSVRHEGPSIRAPGPPAGSQISCRNLTAGAGGKSDPAWG